MAGKRQQKDQCLADKEDDKKVQNQSYLEDNTGIMGIVVKKSQACAGLKGRGGKGFLETKFY